MNEKLVNEKTLDAEKGFEFKSFGIFRLMRRCSVNSPFHNEQNL